jgi:Type II secretion system (T2SS), protein K
MIVTDYQSQSRSGTVYLITLLVVLVVASIAVVMADGAQHRLRGQSTAIAEQKCRQAAMGVIRAVVNDLNSSLKAGALPGLVTVTPAGETVGDCSVVILGRDPDGKKMVYDVIREAGKVDLNNSDTPVLMAVPGMTDQIAAAIIDWRDPDDVVQDIGAEASDAAYTGASVPYAPRNDLFQTIDELRLVRGVTDSLFFGEDANHNGRLDPGEDHNGDGLLTLGFRDLMSIDNREPALTYDGQARIPIPLTLDAMSLGQIRLRMEYYFGEARTNALLDQIPPDQGNLSRLLFLKILPLTNAEILPMWGNIIGNEGRTGLIDAWSVPESILRNLVSAEITNAIITARPATFPPNPAWLIKALTRKQVEEAGKYLTCGSYEFRVDVLAVERTGAGWQRFEARAICSNGIPYLSQLRNSTNAGWPFPWISPRELRQQVSQNDLLTLLTTERN